MIHMFLLLNLLNVFDIITTLLGIKYAGAKEVNPLMNWILSLGYNEFIAFKLIFVMILSFVLFKKQKRGSLLFLNYVYAFVILNNLFTIGFRLLNGGCHV